MIIVAFALLLFSSCSKKAQIRVANASISLVDSVYDFGKIKQSGGTYTHTFKFYNQGAQPLVIENVETSCHCTTVEYTKEPVAPGGEGEVKAIFDAASTYPVKFSKTLTIYANNSEKPKMLTIKGEVLPQ